EGPFGRRRFVHTRPSVVERRDQLHTRGERLLFDLGRRPDGCLDSGRTRTDPPHEERDVVVFVNHHRRLDSQLHFTPLGRRRERRVGGGGMHGRSWHRTQATPHGKHIPMRRPLMAILGLCCSTYAVAVYGCTNGTVLEELDAGDDEPDVTSL